LEFLQEDDAPMAGGPARRRSRGPRPPEHQQIVLRRAIAAGAGVLLLILLVLGVKGCLDARHDRALKDYVRNVTQLTAESKQVSDDFFKLLENPKSLTPLDYEAEIKSNRGAMDSLLTRVDKLSAPGDMHHAQQALELVFQLRRDALASIADEVHTALGKEGRETAIDQIAADMQSFLASDVLYERVSKVDMEGVLKDQGIDGVGVPDSTFLPQTSNGADTAWLDKTTVSDALSRVSGSQAAATPGVHGLGLIQVTAQPSGAVLQSGATTAVPAGGPLELDVQVQNQGDTEEADVVVTVDVNGRSKESRITRIGPGETQTAKVPIAPEPAQGSTVSIDVNVQPVPGEQVSSNNKATYQVTYG
jgi:hypothetical protein